MSVELDQARAALRQTLIEEGKENDYIDDFLALYDRNLKNIDDWAHAKTLLDSWKFERGGDRISGETIALRADDHGKPSFHISPEAFGWMLDKLS